MNSFSLGLMDSRDTETTVQLGHGIVTMGMVVVANLICEVSAKIGEGAECGTIDSAEGVLFRFKLSRSPQGEASVLIERS